MTIQPGDTLPDVTLIRITEDGREPVETGSYFAGRKVVVFSVPGAFTPTCSARHLPGFVEQAEAFTAKGVDEVVGTAVNDAFVLAAWGKAHDVGTKVTLLADGNAEFVKALGLEMDGAKFGMGTRGQRFAMIVDDGRVEQLFVEEPGAFEVSSAEHVLGAL